MNSYNAYTILVTPISLEDGGGFMAKVLEFDGCMADGETPEEALQELDDAARSWILTTQDLGFSIPEPSHQLFPGLIKKEIANQEHS